MSRNIILSRDYILEECNKANCSLEYAEILADRYLKYAKEQRADGSAPYTVGYFIDYTIKWDIARGVVYYDKKTNQYKQI